MLHGGAAFGKQVRSACLSCVPAVGVTGTGRCGLCASFQTEQMSRPTTGSPNSHLVPQVCAPGHGPQVPIRTVCRGGGRQPRISRRPPLPRVARRLTCQRRCWRSRPPARLSPARRVGGLAQTRQVPEEVETDFSSGR